MKPRFEYCAVDYHDASLYYSRPADWNIKCSNPCISQRMASCLAKRKRRSADFPESSHNVVDQSGLEDLKVKDFAEERLHSEVDGSGLMMLSSALQQILVLAWLLLAWSAVHVVLVFPCEPLVW